MKAVVRVLYTFAILGLILASQVLVLTTQSLKAKYAKQWIKMGNILLQRGKYAVHIYVPEIRE